MTTAKALTAAVAAVGSVYLLVRGWIGGPVMHSDSYEYLGAAGLIAAGKAWGSLDNSLVYFPPFYPATLAAVMLAGVWCESAGQRRRAQPSVALRVCASAVRGREHVGGFGHRGTITSRMSSVRPSLPPLVQENLDAFVKGLRDRFGRRLLEVRLFGSYARGEAHEDSDVDCLVLLDRLDLKDDRAVTDLAGDLTWQIGGVVISPLVMSAGEFEKWKASERRTPLEIEREGIPL